MATELSRVILFVSDIDAMTAFYRDVIGLEFVADGSDDDFRILRAGGADVCLHSIPAKYRGEEDTAPREDSYVKYCFRSEDVARDRARLIEHGVRMKKLVRFEQLEFCDGADPEGNIFQISNR